MIVIFRRIVNEVLKYVQNRDSMVEYIIGSFAHNGDILRKVYHRFSIKRNNAFSRGRNDSR